MVSTRKTDNQTLGQAIFNSEGSLVHTTSGFIDAIQTSGVCDNNLQDIWGFIKLLELPQKEFSLDSMRDYCFETSRNQNVHIRRCGEHDWIIEILESSVLSSSENPIILDELTQIPTRQHFYSTLNQLILSIDNSKEEIIVIATDLDHFKRINDTLGHSAGDQLLTNVVARVQNVIRDSDVFVRIGGDEFALILKQDIGSHDAEKLSNRLIERVSRPYLIESSQVNIGMSIGMVSSRENSGEIKDLLKKADIALYRSKFGGRGKHTWFNQKMADEIESRHKLEIELRRALVMNQLKIKFEPQIYQNSGEVHTLHSTMVWIHPQHGELDESVFTEIADSVGLIPDIARWQFDASFAEASKLGENYEISLPVHSSFFACDDFVQTIIELGNKHAVDLKTISLEFSESVLLENERRSGELMLDLSRLGVRISLSDFGSGLVALSYLRVLPFSEIKIDFASMLSKSEENSHSTMAQKIAELGESLGIRVLASIDDEQVIHKVLSEGHFSHIEKIKVAAPIYADKVEDFLEHLNSRRRKVI